MKHGTGLVALVVAAVLVAAAIAAARLGPADPREGPAGVARSGTWLCPHGGDRGWTGTVTLANPGTTDVDVRLTSLGDGPPRRIGNVTVAPGTQVVEGIDARGAGAATYVEYFGGWVGAGWMVRADDPDVGIGTEPCASSASPDWFTAETPTTEGQRASLIVMNPFATAAVIDVVVYSPSRPPLRDERLTDLVIRSGRSIAISLDELVLGEASVATYVVAKVGRVAVSTLGVTDGGGVRSVLGATGAATALALATGSGSGQTQLVTFVPGDEALRFGALVLSEPIEGEETGAGGGLAEVEQAGVSTLVSPIPTVGASLIEVSSFGELPLVAALRADGQAGDDAATGAATAATTWIVPPTVADDPARPFVVIANPGGAPATVSVMVLTGEGAGSPVSLTIEPRSVAPVPAELLRDDPTASVFVTADAPVIALGASTSAGVKGLSLFGLSIGVPVPAWAFPGA